VALAPAARPGRPRRRRVSIVSRYLSVLFLKHLGMCLTGFVTLYLVVDFIEKISEFVAREIEPGSIALYFLAQIPNVLLLLVPVATLAATLITLVLLARNSEIVALKGSGVSLFRLARPLLAMGLALTLAMTAVGNLLTPATSAVANRIWEGEVRGRLAETSPAVVEDVWLKDGLLFERMESYDEARSLALGLTIIMLDESLDLARRLEAARGVFTEGGLRLFEVREKIYAAPDGSRPSSFTFLGSDELFLPGYPSPPAGLGRRALVSSSEMSAPKLAETIRNLQAEGFNPVRQVVDLQFKFSAPFISVIMILVGLPLGFWRERGGSVAVGLVLGLALSFVYMVTQEVSRTMGYAGLLPPLVAAWLPNVFFGLLGMYLFSHLRQ
jgi:lipopolysaccharide export system permease protein